MTINYQIWLTWNAEKEKMRLPVLPEKFDVKNGSNNRSVDLTGLGEVTIMQSRPALQFSFSSFFPAHGFPGMKSLIAVPPILYVRMIERWKKSRVPIHFICTGMYINLYCTIESFNYREDGGDVGTYHYDITLKEYQEVSLKTVTIDSSLVATVQDTVARVDSTSTPKTYTVKKGDCLYNIAKSLYGDGSKYSSIYAANKSLIGSNPNLIKPGQVLKIP
ncbi:LysM peptidoglycan-binding domain-containing protein [Faecalibacterium sp. 4P15]|jgi:nucleoid-associated protein YgaU|uniref:LysM peptidoglycan-binding domain-containing protein n=1 Tax=Faecalibacterium duncaniae (strain DSM 17677 / JCM 31915 / A2-165) TaxID=411483 RepID=UPI00164C8B5B|nr:LysM peptidoglycan-binding domain-containing protein [Faecalibacterium duncaniae]MBC5720799.1 LysM peptidoglycan-binding domain-containing protein [Faecalibacterium duncaniae]